MRGSRSRGGEARDLSQRRPGMMFGLPMLWWNLTPWAWARWKSRWATYSDSTGIKNKKVLILQIWFSFPLELVDVVTVRDIRMNNNNLTKSQLFDLMEKRVVRGGEFSIRNSNTAFWD